MVNNMFRAYNLMENYKRDIIINEGTPYEKRLPKALFMIISVTEEQEVKDICEYLNREKPAKYKNSVIDWDNISHISYNSNVNTELIY